MRLTVNILLALLTIILSNFACFAQQQGDREYTYKSYEQMYDIVDTAKIEVVYVHSMFDPVLKKKDIVYEILSLGEYFSFYRDYSGFKMDSLSNAHAGEKYLFFNKYMKLSREFDNIYGSSREKRLKNYRDSVLVFEGFIMGDRYRYKEPLHDNMNWSIEDNETKEILGYECRKATLRWRGREWTAWYSDIPYNDGPWKFGGLPGLIFEMNDSTGEHKIRAIGIKNDKYPWGLSKGNPFRTKPESYKKRLEEFIENGAKMLVESGMVTGGFEKTINNPRRLFYCPIELE